MYIGVSVLRPHFFLLFVKTIYGWVDGMGLIFSLYTKICVNVFGNLFVNLE